MPLESSRAATPDKNRTSDSEEGMKSNVGETRHLKILTQYIKAYSTIVFPTRGKQTKGYACGECRPILQTFCYFVFYLRGLCSCTQSPRPCKMRLAVSMCATELAGGHANYSDISSTCRLIPLVGDLPRKLSCPPPRSGRAKDLQPINKIKGCKPFPALTNLPAPCS